jgi:hypothetical protein
MAPQPYKSHVGNGGQPKVFANGRDGWEGPRGSRRVTQDREGSLDQVCAGPSGHGLHRHGGLVAACTAPFGGSRRTNDRKSPVA